MGFIDKITTTITGKTREQRESDRLAMNIQRREIQKAAMEERGKQAVRLAQEKERIRANAQIQKMKAYYAPKKPVKYSMPVGGPSLLGGGSLFGASSSAKYFDGKPNAVNSKFDPLTGSFRGGSPASGVKHRRGKSRRGRRRRVVYVRRYV